MSLRGLYPILDLDTLSRLQISPLAAAASLLEARPALIQLRAKTASTRDALEWLLALKPLCQAANVPLVANDRADLALLAEVDGVHFGQDDLPLAEWRRLLELCGRSQSGARVRVGISTHNLAQLGEALAQEPDYVAFGPIFPTQSKANPDPVLGLQQLELAYERCRSAGIPLVAIGGITREMAPEVAARADLVAVISDLYAGGLDEIRARAQSWQRAFAAS